MFKNKSENVAIKHNSIAIAFLYPSQLCQKAGPNTQEKEQKNILKNHSVVQVIISFAYYITQIHKNAYH